MGFVEILVMEVKNTSVCVQQATLEPTVKQKLTIALAAHVYMVGIVPVCQLGSLVSACKGLLVSCLAVSQKQ